MIILEYLKVLLSTQVVSGAFCLTFILVFKREIKDFINRIAKVVIPGGGELSTPQPTKESKKESISNSTPPDLTQENEDIPQTLNDQEMEKIKKLLSAERKRAYIWEYNYLNHFLVYNTQRVLNWFSSLQEPASVSLYHTYWTPLITNPNERESILSALENHYLVIVVGPEEQVTF